MMDEANTILKEGLKDNSVSLTEQQWEVLSNILAKQNVLYIDRTGAGKSETYFILAKILRRNPRAGPVIVVTPLTALMNDQERRARKFGLKAFGYKSKRSGMSELKQGQIFHELGQNAVDILFLTAEMLNEISKDFRSFNKDGNTVNYVPKLLQAAPALKLHPPDLSNVKWDHVPLLVIDEIHYIAEAGHDFRCEYRNVWTEIENHGWYANAPKLGLTATVTTRVRSSLEAAFPALENWRRVSGSLYRENVAIRILPKPANDSARVDYVFQLSKANPSANILVFCKRIQDAKEYSENIIKLGIARDKVGFYYSPKSSCRKEECDQIVNNEKKFREGTIQILFTTCALGLGYDKADIDHVVHMWTPNTLVQYYQEIGRAGRSQSRERSFAHLLPTTPWNSTSWVASLASICWFLARQPDAFANISDLNERAVRQGQKESAVETAIELGIQKHLLVKDPINNSRVGLINPYDSLQTVDALYAEHMRNEVELMKYLAQNCVNEPVCLWKFILNHLEGQPPEFSSCGICSGVSCNPGGDIHPSLENGVYYKLKTVKLNVTVISLIKSGDDLSTSPERLREIFARNFPSMVLEPPSKWTICPLPCSDDENEREATIISQWLDGMELRTFIKKYPDSGSVRNAKSKAEREDILREKFFFDWNTFPIVGNILLYDNCVSSGDTIDYIVDAIRSRLNGKAMEIVVLTREVFINSREGYPKVDTIVF